MENQYHFLTEQATTAFMSAFSTEVTVLNKATVQSLLGTKRSVNAFIKRYEEGTDYLITDDLYMTVPMVMDLVSNTMFEPEVKATIRFTLMQLNYSTPEYRTGATVGELERQLGGIVGSYLQAQEKHTNALLGAMNYIFDNQYQKLNYADGVIDETIEGEI